MTREEAIEILQGAIKKPNTKDGYLGQAIDMAIKVLEQEPILDKIRAEIEQITDTMGVSYNQYVSKIDVLQIIDKYKTESEDKE